MKRLLHIVFLLAASTSVLAVDFQKVSVPTRTPQNVMDSCLLRIENGDTLYMAWLHDVWVYPPMKFRNRSQEKFYWRTVRDVKKCLPYAKMITKDMAYAGQTA